MNLPVLPGLFALLICAGSFATEVRPSGCAEAYTAVGDAAAKAPAGKTTEAKLARLQLAKRVAKKANLPWPESLSDAEAADLIWAAHTLPRTQRKAGLAGTREFFAQFFKSDHAQLKDFKDKLGPVLAKELLRRGVCGDELDLLRGAVASIDHSLPRLVLADFLEENGHPERAEYLRITDERENLLPTQDNLARLLKIQSRQNEIYAAALEQWNQSETGRALAPYGSFIYLREPFGLPVFQPHKFETLFEIPDTVREQITGLRLGAADLPAGGRARQLSQLSFPNLVELDLRGAGPLTPEVIDHLRTWPLPLLAKLDLRDNQLAAVADLRRNRFVEPMRNLRHWDLPNLTYLDLRGNRLGQWDVEQIRSWALPKLRSLAIELEETPEPVGRSLSGWQLPNLTHLTLLNHTPITSAAASELWRWSLPSLIRLEITGRVDTLGRVYLQEWRLPRLVELSLRSNPLRHQQRIFNAMTRQN